MKVFKLDIFQWLKIIIIAVMILSAFGKERSDVIFNLIILIIVFFPSVLIRKKNVNLPKILERSVVIGFLILVVLKISVSPFIDNPLIRPWINPTIFFLFGVVLSLFGFFNSYLVFQEKSSNNPFFISLFSFCFALAIALLGEILEFFFNLYFTNNPEIFITPIAFDLLMVILGSLLVAVYIYLHLAYEKNNFISKLLTRFQKENPNLIKAAEETIKKLIEEGESQHNEFKSTLRVNLHTNQPDKKIEHAVLKTICAFVNSDGGSLLIGIADDGVIKGIDDDHFENKDKFNLHFTNLLNRSIGSENKHLIRADFLNLDNKDIFHVSCLKSKKPIFLRQEGKEQFYIRSGPSTLELTGAKLLEYVNNHYK